MTLHRITRVECDGDLAGLVNGQCWVQVDGHEYGFEDRRLAGWTSGTGDHGERRHYCPECSKMLAARVKDGDER